MEVSSLHARWVAGAFAFFLAVAALPALLGGPSQASPPQTSPPTPTYGPRALWGAVQGCPSAAPCGWGFTSFTITNPGPTITVNASETVTLDLSAGDAFPHQFYVDYNRDNITDPSENQSSLFGGPTPLRHTFFATPTPGPYWYSCSLHTWVMRGQFIVNPIAGNQRPTIQLTNPDGVTQNDWTGGSLKRLTWVPNDLETPPNMLTVWLNYSANGGADTGPILINYTGVPAFDWTVPLIDANDVRVLAEVYDPQGAKGMDSELVPMIDSTRPTVASVSPLDGATGVLANAAVVVNFSEPMNAAATEGAFSLSPSVTGLAFAWSNGGRTMTVTHNPFAGNTLYAATVRTAARDVSDPGNALPGPFSWSFRTTNAVPSLTVLDPVLGTRWTGGASQSVAWAASDAEDAPSALTVWGNYSSTGGPPWTYAFGPLPGDVPNAAWTAPALDTATARFQFIVNDTGGAVTTVLSAMFTIDSTPPQVTNTTPWDGQGNAALNTNVLVTFSEPMNETATGVPAVAGLQQTSNGTWVSLAFSWNAGSDVLTLNPVANLLPATQYHLVVNTSARDRSWPGNVMAVSAVADFVTSAVADTTRPAITNATATPPTNTTGGTVKIAATVIDDTSVASVTVDVALPDTTRVNRTMTATGNLYEYASAWIPIGAYAFTIWASDTSGNWASATGSFTITAVPDTTPPTITNVAATPPTNTTGGSVEVSATVTDDVLVASVSVNVTQPDSAHVNRTMALGTANRYADTSAWTQIGSYSFTIWASDTSGNWRSAAGSFTITATPDTTPPEIRHTPPTGPFRVGDTIAITANVTDADSGVQEVHLVYTPVGGTEQNVTMTLQVGLYRYTVPAQTAAGAVHYRIAARDAAGNWNATTTHILTIEQAPANPPNPPPTDYTIPIVAAVVLAVLGLLALAMLLRRRRKGDRPGPPRSDG